MKKIFVIVFAALLCAATSCHKPEFIESTADRQGLTSLTAIFTFGPYVDQELAKLVIDDDSKEVFEIPVPFYFPETSDDETTPYMTKVRVQAELQPNFTLSPALTLLDLTEDNWFTYTDPKGNSRKICITGRRVKSSACDILSFSLVSPAVSGIVDKAAHHILLPTRDDVSAAKATVMLSPHATISPDPSKARDYTDGVTFTVTADDGTSVEYKVETGDPDKLESGIDVNSIEKLFNLDPVSMLGLPAYNQPCYPSLAVSGGKLIFCYGNETAPMIVNGKNGTKEGSMKLGDAVASVITNDEAEHIVIANAAEGGDNAGTVNIYCTSSPSVAPVLFYSFKNPSVCPIGHKMKVMGDITSDAVITFTAEGIDGVTETNDAVYVTVRGGVAESVDLVNFSGLGYGGWGSAPVYTATVVPVSLNPGGDGWLVDWYGSNADADGNYLLHYVTGAGADNIVATIGDWASNVNCLDSKQFNNCRYAAVFSVSHFPCWGIGPAVYFYEITEPSSPSLMFSTNIAWYQQGDYSLAAGDVTLAPSADGYYLYLYYYDQNSQALGGYVVDCIKR